ncbi:MAG: hypothetical protein PHQ66_00870 [Candidatus Nanoarchaeia archaeon]|nr:hypothetical protein [Candidatus Nanoarchaeia archaeon]MDD5358470.1 hypothetical protein [Candidatus Nanoarchaeia archaeon]MDD5588984.1 hypothetical protein [Candidatus Nanoarchaeia archaeon]
MGYRRVKVESMNKKSNLNKIIPKIYWALLVISVLILGISLYFNLSQKISKEFLKEIIIVLALSMLSSGFIAFQIEKSSKFKILVEPFLISCIFMMISLLIGIYYLISNSELNRVVGAMSITFFMGGFVSYSIVLISAWYIEHKENIQ